MLYPVTVNGEGLRSSNSGILSCCGEEKQGLWEQASQQGNEPAGGGDAGIIVELPGMMERNSDIGMEPSLTRLPRGDGEKEVKRK